MSGKLSTDQGPQSVKTPAAANRRVQIPSRTQERPPRSGPRAVEREVAGRVAVGSGVLVLPTLASFGVPVILDVPNLGYVELSEGRYAELYDELFSADPKLLQEAIAALKEIKAVEDAEIAALRQGRINSSSPDADATADDLPAAVERDLSEPISFERLPFKFQAPRYPNASHRLY